MASWIIHLRIADALLRRIAADDRFPMCFQHKGRQEYPAVEVSHFLAGNIAPDCGKPAEDGGFDPDMHVTHFTRTGKGKCEYQRFWEEFGRHETDRDRLSFYLGYFTHLMTDVLWVERINNPTKEKYRELYLADRTEYYREVKGDWYGQDFLYLQTYPDFFAYAMFRQLQDYENDWLPFYGRDNLRLQFRNIAAFYDAGIPKEKRSFRYLTAAQADEFVKLAAADILEELREFCMICAK